MRPPATCLGTSRRCSSGPSPRRPSSSLPQQNATLVVVTPQVWSAPAVISRQVLPPLTATGVGLLVREPLPNSPSPLNPQQYATRPVVSAQVCPDRNPAETVWKASGLETCTGSNRRSKVPSPRAPLKFAPQHQIS